MKITKSLTLLFLSSIFLLSSCDINNAKLLSLSITSQDDKTFVMAGETLQLTVHANPEKAPSTVSWSSSDELLATIDTAGLVSTLEQGNVFIYATSTIDTDIRGEFVLLITENPNPNPKSITVVSATGLNSLSINATLQLTHTVLPANSNQEVTWSTSSEAVATVSSSGLVNGKTIGDATITATAVGHPTITGSINLAVTDVLPPEPTVEWDEIEFSNHEQFMAAADNGPLKIKGQVHHISPVSGVGNETTVNYYIQNGSEGFYVFGQNTHFFPITLNGEYVVGGFKKYYFTGAHEIVNVEFFEAISEDLIAAANDISAMAVMDRTEMNSYHASYIEINDAVINSLPSSFTAAYSVNIEVGSSIIAYRVDPSVCGATEFAAINTIFQSTVVGAEISFKGIMSAFGYGTPANQIIALRASDITASAMNDQGLVESAVSLLVLENTLDLTETSITLPASIGGYTNVNVTWESANSAISASGVVTRPLHDVDVTLTAKVKKGSAEATKNFVVTVLGSDQSGQDDIHLLNFEDALDGNSYDNSLSMPSYNDEASLNLATLGTPLATWYYGRTLISSLSSDRVHGKWAARMQSDKLVQANSGRLELKDDFVFDFLEFNLATYGSDALNGVLQISYSLDQGTTWIDMDRTFVSTLHDFELCRIAIPNAGQASRVAISLLVDGASRRVNFDDIRLVDVGV